MLINKILLTELFVDHQKMSLYLNCQSAFRKYKIMKIENLKKQEMREADKESVHQRDNFKIYQTISNFWQAYRMNLKKLQSK